MIGYRYHPDARAEYRSTLAWYRNRSPDAARGLLLAVEEGIRSIRELPLAWPTWRGGPFRKRVLRRFPYSLFYAVHANTIVIFAIAHHSRSPDYWLARTK